MKKKTLALKKGTKLVKKTRQDSQPTKIPFLKLIYISIGLNTVVLAAILFFKNSLPPQVPLFYGLPEGEEQLTNSLNLIIAPTISFFVLGINVIFSLMTKNDLLKKTLITASFFVSLFSFITLVQIFLLIGPF